MEVLNRKHETMTKAKLKYIYQIMYGDGSVEILNTRNKAMQRLRNILKTHPEATIFKKRI